MNETNKYSGTVAKESGKKIHKVSYHQFITAIRGLYLDMQFLGIWPQTSSQKWYDLIWYIQSIGLVFQVFGPTAGLIVQRHNAKKLIDCLGLVIPIACICVKWCTFSMRRKTVAMILYSMEKDWINLDKDNSISRSVPDSKKIMVFYAKMANIFFYCYVITIVLVIANYVRDSLTVVNSRSNETNLDRLLPIPNSWYPLDYNQSFNIQFLTVTQTITATTLTLANAAMDSFFVTVTLHLCGQFKILRHFIEGITYDSSKPNCTTKIKLTVQRHQILLKLGETLQESYSLIILEQFVACTLSICFLGYIIIVEMESNSAKASVLLETGFLFISALQMIFAYCLVGDHLSNESLAVAMAVYNAQWYNYTRSNNVSFSIVMIRARKPVEISGAQLLTLSLENFTVLMKAAASYISVLRTIGVGTNVSEN